MAMGSMWTYFADFECALRMSWVDKEGKPVSHLFVAIETADIFGVEGTTRNQFERDGESSNTSVRTGVSGRRREQLE